MTFVPPSAEGVREPAEIRSVALTLTGIIADAYRDSTEAVFGHALETLVGLTTFAAAELGREREARRQDAQRYAWKLGIEL
jgi:CII-binding regulator of phage lambda lysogenization HflD